MTAHDRDEIPWEKMYHVRVAGVGSHQSISMTQPLTEIQFDIPRGMAIQRA